MNVDDSQAAVPCRALAPSTMASLLLLLRGRRVRSAVRLLGAVSFEVGRPHADCPICRGGEDPFACRVEGGGEDWSAVPSEGGDQPPLLGHGRASLEGDIFLLLLVQRLFDEHDVVVVEEAVVRGRLLLHLQPSGQVRLQLGRLHLHLPLLLLPPRQLLVFRHRRLLLPPLHVHQLLPVHSPLLLWPQVILQLPKVLSGVGVAGPVVRPQPVLDRHVR
mmetsp:Transcript_25647/g.84710  ORF Transcript_25647/g.84710 Transcript_25647/m.84710 type:complete len:218 (+) Transcript_25647:337-990(+)